jgi:hypothetical protein
VFCPFRAGASCTFVRSTFALELTLICLTMELGHISVAARVNGVWKFGSNRQR